MITAAAQCAADRLAGELLSVHGLDGAEETDRIRVRQVLAMLCHPLEPRLMDWVPLAQQRAPLNRLALVLGIEAPRALLAELAGDPAQGAVVRALARVLIDALDAEIGLEVCRAAVTVLHEEMSAPRVLPDPAAPTTKREIPERRCFPKTAPERRP